VQQVAIDVSHLPAAAQELGDLTQRERDVLALLGEGTRVTRDG
jgi:DNA-binding CsgD family transcriptional regulator